ncbi:MAG: PilZ domain-containing protein [Spongiibacteraceae bacterium]|jgi:hypothetical protein|nr:PilZ domain-containing protein [Spongiibacteraceae bacterium]
MALDRAYEEKRSFIRMRIDTPVQVTHSGQTFVARCKDLSGAGMLITCDRKLAINDLTEVCIEQEGPNRFPFRASATVSRIEPGAAGEYDIGLTLTEIHDTVHE